MQICRARIKDVVPEVHPVCSQRLAHSAQSVGSLGPTRRQLENYALQTIGKHEDQDWLEPLA